MSRVSYIEGERFSRGVRALCLLFLQVSVGCANESRTVRSRCAQGGSPPYRTLQAICTSRPQSRTLHIFKWTFPLFSFFFSGKHHRGGVVVCVCVIIYTYPAACQPYWTMATASFTRPINRPRPAILAVRCSAVTARLPDLLPPYSPVVLKFVRQYVLHCLFVLCFFFCRFLKETNGGGVDARPGGHCLPYCSALNLVRWNGAFCADSPAASVKQTEAKNRLVIGRIRLHRMDYLGFRRYPVQT